MLIDEVDITLRAGHGGAGKTSFDGHGADGGNGGRGGNVYVVGTSDLTALNKFSSEKKWAAQDGDPGRKKRSAGKTGDDLTLSFPVGTTLVDKETGKETEITKVDEEVMICRGGQGGKGNLEFKSPYNLSTDFSQPGKPGEYKKFKVILRFIADFGLIGLPNAGKSSLLNQLTNAKANIGAYPFTTLEPNLGAFGEKIIADIPGLIEGASKGKGLGVNFLKHIEKVKVLIHLISLESEDLVKDYQTINTELEKYNPDLLNKNRIIVLTKEDLVDRDLIVASKELLIKLGYPIFTTAVGDRESIDIVKEYLRTL